MTARSPVLSFLAGATGSHMMRGGPWAPPPGAPWQVQHVTPLPLRLPRLPLLSSSLQVE